MSVSLTPMSCLKGTQGASAWSTRTSMVDVLGRPCCVSSTSVLSCRCLQHWTISARVPQHYTWSVNLQQLTVNFHYRHKNQITQLSWRSAHVSMPIQTDRTMTQHRAPSSIVALWRFYDRAAATLHVGITFWLQIPFVSHRNTPLLKLVPIRITRTQKRYNIQ